MTSLIHFRVTFEKWLESDCSMVILGGLLLVCGLYDGIGVVGVRVYPGGFTLYFSDFNVRKRLAVLSTRQLNFSTPNRTIPRKIAFTFIMIRYVTSQCDILEEKMVKYITLQCAESAVFL